MKYKTQLFFLHFAGGNRYSFDFLVNGINDLTTDIESIPLELPGRGKRFDEALLLDKRDAINDYINQIRNKRNGQPYIIYGHSMGATLGLSIVKTMEGFKDPPIRFIATGNAGPGVKDEDPDSFIGKRYLLNNEDFKVVLRELGGVPEEILMNDELFNFFSKIIRADFRVLEEGENYEKEIRINTPINAFMGDQENMSNQIDNWSNYTTSNFEGSVLSGNHFFIHDHAKEITTLIINSLSQDNDLIKLLNV